MKKATGKKVTFELDAEVGSSVSVAGSFNNWDPSASPMVDNPGGGKYSTVLKLSPGRYEYKFVVNGEWLVDPKCPDWAPNNCGSLNSVLTI